MKKAFIIILALIIYNSFAQVSINSYGSESHSSAMLEVESTSKGMLIPRMTASLGTSIAYQTNGLLVFDETIGGFWFYENNEANWS